MRPCTFPWPDTADHLEALLRHTPLRIERRTGSFVADPPTDQPTGQPNAQPGAQPSWRFTPPLVQPIPADCSTPEAYLRGLHDTLGLQAVVLLRAGATAIGLWRDDELLAHKAFKRYVVRGNGKAQTTHLATKGKSKYGSRLRLQNARRQLEETNERLTAWTTEHGPFDRLLYAAPERLWADLLRADPPPPFDPDSARRIPLHTHTPDHRELLRVRRIIARGRIEGPDSG